MNVCAEIVFWDEFNVRYNFIAVDYLIYTTEVLGNIWESYNIPLIIGAVVLVVVFVCCFSYEETGRIAAKQHAVQKRTVFFPVLPAVPAGGLFPGK